MYNFHKKESPLLGLQGLGGGLGFLAGGGLAELLYSDDVFSAFLYDGNSSTQTITNNIDLSGEGGLVWCKNRDDSVSHILQDTERGTNALESNSSAAQFAYTTGVSSFTSTGFTVGVANAVNGSGKDICSWTFRKAPGFFDVVTYTGNGSSTGDSQTISHNLGSTPGFVIIKRTSGTGDWVCWHRSISTGQPRKYIELDSTNGTGTMGADIWGTVSSTEFEVKHNGTVGDSYEINKSGETYVAYFFAHDDQSFGTDEDEAIIKCGSYTANNSSSGNTIDVGFEPQWLLIKSAAIGGAGYGWTMHDNMRDTSLFAESNNQETNAPQIEFRSNGFHCIGKDSNINDGTGQYIYVAIRRPHKPPTTATEVFAVSAAAGDSDITTNFPVDLAFQLRRTAGSRAALTRLQGKKTLETRNTSAETLNANAWYESNTKFLNSGLFTANSVFYLFKRAPGFMDVVTYKGAGNNQVVKHNLGVSPELTIIKRRDTASTYGWYVWSSAAPNTNSYSGKALLNSNAQYYPGDSMWGSAPTSTQLTLGLVGDVSHSGGTFIAYLFATLAGISKVGTYTGAGSGNSVDVDCGFTAGARFVVIKDLEATANWYVYDSARGIGSGNDPILFFDTNAAEQTAADDIDPLNAGFKVVSTNSGLNTSGRSYLFLAIA